MHTSLISSHRVLAPRCAAQDLKGFRDGVIIMLSTPYCIGGVVAMLLHLLLPMEATEQEMIVIEAAEKLGHKVGGEHSPRGRSIRMLGTAC